MPKPNHYGLILAGGRGTRFWPRSRRHKAKQVLNFFGDRSLIQQTVDRLKPLLPPERIWVITNEYLRDEIVSQLPDVPKRQILSEPAQRNTAPAIGLAAQIIESIDPGAVMGVFPADHLILRPARYLRLLRPAFRAAEKGKMAVLGIEPRWPDTGFGYVEFPPGIKAGTLDTHPVLKFREKPDLATAREYLAAGCFYWNAGMFFWRTNVILDALRELLPKTATLLASLPPFSSRRFPAALKEAFPGCDNISIDYAVLEKAGNRVVGIAADDIRWSDVGSWNAVYELEALEEGANVTRGEALLIDSKGNFVDVPDKTVALVGVHNLVVVDTADALLVIDRSRAQQVSDVVKMLEQQKRDELL